MSAEAQLDCATMITTIFGDLLFIPDKRPTEFLSPEDLRGKILIRDKPEYASDESDDTTSKMISELAR